MVCNLSASLIAVAIGANSYSQPPLGDDYWEQIRFKADSILIGHFGHQFFNDHIFFDPEYEINYIAFSTGFSCGWQERDTVTMTPEFVHFEYLIGLDKNNSTRTIEIAFHPNGTLVSPSYDTPPSKDQIEMARIFSREVLFPIQEFYGFVQCDGACSFKYDLKGFIKLAQQYGIKCRIKDAVGLQWISPDSTSWAHGERLGRYELELACNAGKSKARSSDGMTRNYVIHSIVFDPFTGKFIRTYTYNTPRKIDGNLCGSTIINL